MGISSRISGGGGGGGGAALPLWRPYPPP